LRFPFDEIFDAELMADKKRGELSGNLCGSCRLLNCHCGNENEDSECRKSNRATLSSRKPDVVTIRSVRNRSLLSTARLRESDCGGFSNQLLRSCHALLFA